MDVHRFTDEDVDNAADLLAAVLNEDRAAFDHVMERAGYAEWQSRRADALVLYVVLMIQLFRRPLGRRRRPGAAQRQVIVRSLLASDWGDLVDRDLAEHCLALACRDVRKLAPPTTVHLRTSAILCARLMQLELHEHQYPAFYRITTGVMRRRVGSANAYRFG